MTVTVDVAVENIRTGTTSPQTFTTTGAASSGIKGFVLCIMHGASSTDHVSAASYGGVALERKQRNTDTATEAGAAEIWFLGSGVPQGAQTVSYTCGSTTDDIHAVAITLLAAGDLIVADVDGVDNNTANPSVTLQYGGRTGMAFAAMYSGLTDISSVSAGSNCTAVGTGELSGNFTSRVIRQTTGGTSDFTIAAASNNDDVAFAAVAVCEKQTPSLAADQGSYSLSGQTATLRDHNRSGHPAPIPSMGLIGGFSAVASGPVSLTADAGALVLVGQAASTDISLPTTGGQLAFSGQSATTDLSLPGATGSLALTGGTAVLDITYSTVGDAGALVLTPAAATTALGLTAAAGSLLGSGGSASTDLSLTAAAGALALTGADASLEATSGVVLAGTAGALTLAGADADLVTSGNAALDAAAGAIALTGGTATTDIALPATGGTIAVAGADASTALTLTAALGALALTGGDATLEQSSHVTLTADSGQITLAGSDADLVTSGNITLDAEAGTLTLAGADAELETAGGEPEEPPFEAGGGTPFSRKAWDRLKKKRAEEKRGVIDIAASVQADYAYTTGRMRHVLRLVHTVTDIPAPIKLTKRQSRQRQQEEELLFGLLD